MTGKLNHCLIIMILNIITFIESKMIVIPFKTVKDTDSNYIKSLLQYQLYTEMEIGDTKQKVNLAISTDTSFFNIESYLLNETFYSPNKSTSYKNNTYLYKVFEGERTKIAEILNETFYFKDSMKSNYEIYQDIKFNYIIQLSTGSTGKDNGYIDNSTNLISGVIGLQMTREYNENNHIILAKSLKTVNAIDNIIWHINYITDNEGYLIFGEYPHQYNNSYLENNLKKINCITLNNDFFWYFIFTDIRIGQNKIKKSRTADYSPQIGIILGTSEYGNMVKGFFGNKNKCSYNEIEFKKQKYFYYECDNNTNVDDFEPIVFIHQELEYNFTLDKNDLFIDFNNKKYFLVVFKNEYYQEKWVLGKPFVKKYQFVFDYEAKIMLFYKNKNGSNINENQNNGVKVLIYILIVLLGFLVLSLGIYIGKKFFGKRKKRKANELEDSINDEENQNSINVNNNEESPNSCYNKMGI